MLLKVYGTPTPTQARRKSAAGIPQVVIHLAKHLPEFGFELLDEPEGADLRAFHAGSSDGQLDIAHVHGLYPTGMPHYQIDKWHWEVNRRVIEDIRQAQPFITVPSEWVADTIRRDMRLEPRVIPWAVDMDEWSVGVNKGYVLWNKNRIEGVCTPDYVNHLARQYPDVKFVSTFGDDSLPNLLVIGQVPHAEMKQIIQNASVYLATTLETGDIGSLEAMASGVPVLGFNQGATAEIVKHGTTGFLAEVNDLKGLGRGLEYVLANRDELGLNSREQAAQRSWRQVAREMAEFYHEALAYKNKPRSISVVMPCYNYAKFLPGAVESVLAQEVDCDVEIIVVNDKSPDNTSAVAAQLPVTLIDLEHNWGVANARNIGINAANGDYIVCLDPDDFMGEGMLQVCKTALDKDNSLGVAYTGLAIYHENGEPSPNGFPGQADLAKQVIGQNQVHTAAMFRKMAWVRAGGYNGRYTPAEDAEFWLKIALIGYNIKQVDTAHRFIYRIHANSLSRSKPEPKYAKDKAFVAEGHIPSMAFIPSTLKSWPVRNYNQPKVSVIIPVGPGHETTVYRSVDSVYRQSFWNWELIVVNDSGQPLSLAPFPFVKEFATAPAGRQGASVARNIGLEQAKGNFIVFLDADDELDPEFLRKTLQKFKYTGAYVYTDYYAVKSDGQRDIKNTPEWDTGRLFRKQLFHAVTCLVPAYHAKQIRFDEAVKSYEDTYWYMHLVAEMGLCGVRLPEPLLYYYIEEGSLRRDGKENVAERKGYFMQKYGDYIEGTAEPVCGCLKPQSNQYDPEADAEDLVLVVYNSEMTGKHQVVGRTTRRQYGRRRGGDLIYVDPSDVDHHRFKLAAIYEPPPTETVIPDGVKVVEYANS